MGKSNFDVESDDADCRYIAERGYKHRFTVRFHHVVYVPFKFSRSSTSFKFSQASTSSSLLTTLDICQHYAKPFFQIFFCHHMPARYVLDPLTIVLSAEQAPTHHIATCHHEPFVCDEQPAWRQRRVRLISLAIAG